MEMTVKQIINERIGQEVDSLTMDGYRVFLRCTIFSALFVKLRHRSNGNVISIVGNYGSRTIMISRNGSVKKRYQV